MMSRFSTTTVLACIAFFALGSASAENQTNPRVRVQTSMGSFLIELDTARAPLSSENFLGYVREGFYDGTVFHRVIANFVAQGGGYTASYELKPTREPVANESGNGLSNLRATVGLARSTEPHSGNSQFYVNLVDNPALDPQPSRWGYAVFGRIVDGMEILDRIGHVRTGKAGPFEQDAPVEPVIIEKMESLP